MSVYDFKERLETSIDEQRTRLGTALANGVPKDHAEYRFLVGQLRGLDVAKGMLLEQFKRMEQGRVSNDDESDEGRASG